ncbi:hypothetical protein [Pseudomonas putida]|uniref:hypothetical protein n=1 Tax=Pseudomonas putida TaxID=303 RepID=UPI0021B135A4|nr:hypothetical protein [Pseudomonas putida]
MTERLLEAVGGAVDDRVAAGEGVAQPDSSCCFLLLLFGEQFGASANYLVVNLTLS